MTPDFAPASLPMLTETIALAERAAAGEVSSPEEARSRFLTAMETATAAMRGPRGEEWALASYAIAALVDELLIVDIPWDGRTWWENHAVEVELFGTRRRATEFYDRAAKAATFPERDAHSVFVGAVVMGFRGILRDKPEALEAWLRSNGQTIKLGQTLPTIPEQAEDLPGAPPLKQMTSLVWHIVGSSLIFAILIVTAWWAFVVS